MRPTGDRRRAHVGIDLGLGSAPNRHWVKPIPKVSNVGGDHHATGSDLIAHLYCSEVRFTLRHARHLRSDNAKSRALKLSHRNKSLGIDNAHPLAACADKVHRAVCGTMTAVLMTAGRCCSQSRA